MHHFTAAAGILTNLLGNNRLSEEQQGNVLGSLGLIFMEQRDWPQALESYQKATEWKEKTGQHHQLGSTWHQIGIVCEEQGDFAESLRHYLLALALFSKMAWEKESGIVFGSIRRIFPNLSSAEKERLKEALPETMYRLLNA